MIEVARKSATRLAQGNAPGDLWLRIVGTQRAGQLVRLSAPKCTIGSSDSCTLRLRAGGVQPIHCLILRGQRGTVACSLGSSARLNGRRFSDAALSAGDRLKIGPIELEVLPSEPAAGEPSEGTTSHGTSGEPIAVGRPDAKYVQQSREARSRARKLAQAVRGLRDELARLREQIDQAAEVGRQHVQFTDEHRQRVATFHAERDQWQASREQAEGDFQSRKHHVEQAASELEAARQLTEDTRRAWEADRLAAQEQLQRHNDAQLRLRQELHSERTGFELQRLEWQEEAARLRSEIEQERAALAEAGEQLSRQHCEFDEQRSQLHNESTAGSQHFERQRHEWTAEKQEESARLADDQARLDAQWAQLRRDQEELAALRHSCESDQQRHGEERADTHRNLEERVAGLALQETRIRQQAEAGEAREQSAAVRERELQSATDELQRAQSELERRQLEWESCRAQLDEDRRNGDAARGSLGEAVAARHREREEFELNRQQAEELAALKSAEPAQDTVDPQQTILAVADVHSAQASLAIAELAWETLQRDAEQQLARLSGELDSREQSLAGELNEQQRSLETQRASLAEREQALVAEREALAACSAEEARRLAQRANEIMELTDELRTRQEQFQRERTTALAEQETTDHGLREQLAASELRCQKVETDSNTALEEARAKIREELARIELERSETSRRPADEHSDVRSDDEEAPSRIAAEADSLRDFRDEAAADEDESVAETEPAPRTRRTADGASDDEASIEQYMADLLLRMRGGAPAEAIAPQPAPRRKRKSDQPQPIRVAATAPQVEHIPVVDMPTTLTEMTRRSPAESTDLAAMRELANTQVQMALDVSKKKRLLNTTLVTASAALGSLIAAMILLSITSTYNTGIRTMAMAGFVGAVFWLFTAGTTLQQLKAARRSQDEVLRDNLARAGRGKPAAPQSGVETHETDV